MAAPSLIDGFVRAIEEFAVPSVGLIAVVGMVRIVYGVQEAGMAYLAATGLVLLMMHSKAKYWNARYTFAGATIGLLAWFGLPNILPRLVPTAFATIGAVGGRVILFSIGLMTIENCNRELGA